MNVLQITSKSKGGAGIAALRLHKALRAHGISSAFLSKDLTVDFNDKVISDPFFSYKRSSIIKRSLLKIKSLFILNTYQKINNRISEHSDHLKYEMLSLPFSIYQLNKHILVQEADIINLHWVGGILDYDSFFRNIKKPIVWTLHDMNPFLGMFHYKEDEQTNMKYISEQDAKIKKFKRKAIESVKHGAVISPSKWLLNEALNSKIFHLFKFKECIPNAIDLDVFKPLDKNNLRRKRSIPESDLVILFISGDIECRRKGLDLLLDAINQLDHISLTVLTVGKGELDVTHESIKMISLGLFESESEMSECYSLADVFVLPSREDNLPNVMLESFACGTPVISFAIGGVKEHVKEGLNGYLSNDIFASSLKNSIQRFNDQRENFSRDDIREYAEKHFNFKEQAKKYLKIYLNLLNE